MTDSLLILFSIVIPLVGAILIAFSNKIENLRESFTLITSICLIVIVYSILPSVLNSNSPSYTLLTVLPGLSISFRVEPLGMLFACIASVLWLINSIYSIGYMRGNNEKNQTRFYVCFAIAISSTMGVAFASNLFTLFIFYEVLTLSTYPLVTHKGNEEAIRGGRIYLGILLSTSICFFLPAIIATHVLAGTTEFKVGGILNNVFNTNLIVILLLLYAYGIGKAALMPVHKWLPNAMVAPTPVSALLHAVAVVKAGVFSIVKIVSYIFSPTLLLEILDLNFLLYLSGATIIIASIIALRSDNLKRRLAYSTVSQLSYVIMATALLVPISIKGAAMHILAHAFGKITLFFAAGSIYTVTKKTKVSELNGIGHTMPITMLAFAIGSLSMIGVPPTAGFLSKWYILQGAFSVESWFAVGVIIVSTLLNAGYFLPIIYMAFFRKSGGDSASHIKEAPMPIVISISITALMTLVLFLFPAYTMNLLNMFVGNIQ